MSTSRPLPPPPPPGAATDCYRHPGRPAGRRCTRCGRPACEDCLRQAAVGSQCVECLRAAQPSAATKVRDWSAGQRAIVTMTVMAVNALVFVWMALSDPNNAAGRGFTEQNVNLALYRGDPLRMTGVRVGSDIHLIGGVAQDEWYRVISSGFIHFGLLHLGFNLFLLYQLGNLLEPQIGRIRFSLLFLAALLGGSAGVLLISPNAITGGASGAVFGLLGAAAVSLYRHGINPFSTSIGTLIVLNVIITFTLPNISIGGHLGGLVAGAAAGWFAAAPHQLRVPPALAVGAPIAVATIAAVVIYITGSA